MLSENTIYSLQMYGTMEGSVPFIMDNSHVCPVYKNKCEKSEIFQLPSHCFISMYVQHI